MSGRGSAKKLSLEPTRAFQEMNDDSGASSDLIEVNLQNHPLLNTLVMETLFKQYSLLNHDAARKTPLAAVSRLRQVCKTWNREIGKMVRKKTHIDVERLLTTYPRGLGWGANTTGLNYTAPMPEEIGTFENLDVTIKKCTTFTSSLIIQWFQVMGGSVKSLRLTCPLTCYHQNRFIENILTKWCPNLRSFTLKGAWCFESLVQNSFFINSSPLADQCNALKEFVFHADDIFRNQPTQQCKVRIEELEVTGEKFQISDYEAREIFFKHHSKFLKHLNSYMTLTGEPGTMPDQEEKLLSKLVMRPIGLASVSGISAATFGPHVPDFFQQQFKCDPGFETDGGVLGQLMKMSKVEKLVIRYRQDMIVNELLSMFLYRPNLWLSSLKDFEFISNTYQVVVHELVYGVLRTTFSKLGFPVQRLKFRGGTREPSFERSHERMLESVLNSYGESLEELRIKWEVHGHDDWMEFPVLPKLKLLDLECLGDTILNPTNEDFWVKFPKLEECVLSDEALTYVSLFVTDSLGLFGHPLKVLKLADGYLVDEADIERIVVCFPNLKTVDLSIIWGSEDFRGFWAEMSKLSLEHIKVLTSFVENFQHSIEENIANFGDLKSLELEHEGGPPFQLASNVSSAFAMAPKLRFLKFVNFKVRRSEVKEFKRNLASCVVAIRVVRG